MTPNQIDTVRGTWAKVAPIADQAAVLFYDRLFEIDPTVEPLFGATDMSAQRKKLIQVISAAVGGLDRLDELVPVVEDLGRRHTGYGVTDAHYDSVGAALLWTLEKGLGADWTSDTAAAWTETYTLLADVMRNAARQETAHAAE